MMLPFLSLWVSLRKTINYHLKFVGLSLTRNRMVCLPYKENPPMRQSRDHYEHPSPAKHLNLQASILISVFSLCSLKIIGIASLTTVVS